MNAYRCQLVDRPLDATVTLPGSKSITNRVLITAALADGTSLLHNILIADDTNLMIAALRALGIFITLDESSCTAEVTGCGGLLPASHARIECGNAGTVMRFCTALCALGQGRFELDGSTRMRERPIGPLVDMLRNLGTHVEYLDEDGYPPLVIHADGLRGGTLSVPAPESSQFVSALLLTSPYGMRDLMLEIRGKIPSGPYLKLTTAIMQRFGVTTIEQDEGSEARFIVASSQRYRGTNFGVEPDASNATYFLAAAAVIGGSVCVEGLGTDSLQGDVRFVDVLEQMGCRIERRTDRLTVEGPPPGERLRGVEVDVSDMPDTAQTLAVVGLFAEGPTTIRNIGNLRIKETDRLAALQTELTKLGASVQAESDTLTIHPPDALRSGSIDTYDDHRMAMSFAIAGLRIPNLTINDPGCCAKTFPDFFSHFNRMAGLVST